MNPKANIQERLEDRAEQGGLFRSIRILAIGQAQPFRRLAVTASQPGDDRRRRFGDGADARRAAKGGKSQPVELKGFGISYSDLPWYGEDPTMWEFDRRAAESAFGMAGIKATDISYLHTHDCSHVSGICTAEMIGYLEPGKVLMLRAKAALRFDGDRPMSTHGGRHAFGHAWGASAGTDTYEAVLQMRGQAGPRQIKRAGDLRHPYARLRHDRHRDCPRESCEMKPAEQPGAIEVLRAGSQGVFRAVKCKACSKHTFPPTGCCEHCGSWEVEPNGTERRGHAASSRATTSRRPAIRGSRRSHLTSMGTSS